jgi:hypothetical protein
MGLQIKQNNFNAIWRGFDASNCTGFAPIDIWKRHGDNR